MPSLSFDEGKDGKAIALVKGGINDGDVLYLHEDGGGGRRPKPIIHRAKYALAMRGISAPLRIAAWAQLEEALAAHSTPDAAFADSSVLKTIYESILKDTNITTTIELDDEGSFQLIPSPIPSERQIFYIAGASGSGKSYITKGLAEFYHKLYPSRNIYLISKLASDETLDSLKFIKRIPIQSLVDSPPDLAEFEQSFTIFDDYDTFSGPAAKIIHSVIEDLCAMGRHKVASVALCTHKITNYAKTRLVLNESTHYIVFPQSSSFHALKHLLKNYVGVDEVDLKRHRKLGSRWICYSKGFPQYAIAQKDAELLHQRD